MSFAQCCRRVPPESTDLDMASFPVQRQGSCLRIQSFVGRLCPKPYWAAAILITSLSAFPVPAAATAGPPGRTVESIRAWLLEHNPELRALRADAEAARARILPAGALQDPTVVAELRRDVEQPSRGRMEPEITYSFRQRFPLWGKRALARSVAQHEADAIEIDRSAVARTLLAESEAAYVRYWHAGQAVAVLDRRATLLHQIEEIAGVRYALGMAPQQDAIRAQVAQTSLQRERIERLATRLEAAALLNAALDRAADAPLATPDDVLVLPPPRPGASDALQIHAHPLVRSQKVRAEAARANVELQRRNRFPDVTVGVGAMESGGDLARAELMFEVEIPFQQQARRERERESRLLEEAALARVEAAQRAVERQGAAARAQWTSARERRELIEKSLLPQADATYRSALASYQVGEVDFGTLLEAVDEWVAADLERLDALRDELLGAAAVRAIEGDNP